jgi:hypothetical protein
MGNLQGLSAKTDCELICMEKHIVVVCERHTVLCVIAK